MIILIYLFSCLWAILIANDTLLNQFKTYLGLGPNMKATSSEYKFIDFILFLIWKGWSCPLCLSYHLFWISYLIIYSSPMGLIYGIGAYYLTGILQKYIIY